MNLKSLLKASAFGLVAATLSGQFNAAAPLGPVGIQHNYCVECYGADGQLKWKEEFKNLVVTAGLNDYLDKYYKGSTYTAAHYVGLTTGSPSFAAGDTMASHAGWTESTVYSEGARQTFTPGTVSAASVDNSGSKAVFSINTSGTVGGAFLSTDSTKGGSTGTLVGGNAFTGGNRTVANGDTLNVTVTASLTSS